MVIKAHGQGPPGSRVYLITAALHLHWFFCSASLSCWTSFRGTSFLSSPLLFFPLPQPGLIISNVLAQDMAAAALSETFEDVTHACNLNLDARRRVLGSGAHRLRAVTAAGPPLAGVDAALRGPGAAAMRPRCQGTTPFGIQQYIIYSVCDSSMTMRWRMWVLRTKSPSISGQFFG